MTILLTLSLHLPIIFSCCLRLFWISNNLLLHCEEVMCRMIGYCGGIILFMVLGVKQVKGYEFFYATAIINIICIGLVIIFRVIAKYLNGFWKIWWKRMQKQVNLALSCLSQYTQMPEYQITTTTIDRYGNKSVSTSTTCNTLIWGCVECVVCAALTILSPLIAAFVLFCYGEAIVHQCRWRSEQKQKKKVKEEEIARQSARMSLGVPLNNADLSEETSSQNQPVVNYVPQYPMVQGTYVSKTYVKTVFMPNQFPQQGNGYNNPPNFQNQQGGMMQQPQIQVQPQPQPFIIAQGQRVDVQPPNIQQQVIRNDEL